MMMMIRWWFDGDDGDDADADDDDALFAVWMVSV